MTEESKTLRYEDPHCDDVDKKMDKRISQVAFVAYQQAKMKGFPVARYDAEKKATYLLYLTDTASIRTSHLRKRRHRLDLRCKIRYNGSRNLQRRKDERP